jgi:ribulose-phosphate 3-epimerase
MAERKNLIAPSILASDFTQIGDAIRLVEQSEGDWIHLDIMDGSFVPPITFGSQMISAIRSKTRLPLDAHLMTLHPGTHLESFAKAGTDRFTFHVEAEVHSHRLLGEIRRTGMKAGISIVPSTPVSAIRELLGVADQVLVMTVNPGWGGQSLIPSTLEKVRELDALRKGGAGDFLICIDGGFSEITAKTIWDSGVDVAVMGSAFFSSRNPQNALRECRQAGRGQR